MPRGDGTGPMGMGPMTGRGMGYCAGYAVPGYANAGFAMGRGRGYRRMYHLTGMPGWACHGAYPYSPGTAVNADEKEILKSQADFLEEQLSQVRDRLSRFGKTE